MELDEHLTWIAGAVAPRRVQPWTWPDARWYIDSGDASGSPISVAPDRTGGADFSSSGINRPAVTPPGWGDPVASNSLFVQRAEALDFDSAYTLIARVRPNVVVWVNGSHTAELHGAQNGALGRYTYAAINAGSGGTVRLLRRPAGTISATYSGTTGMVAGTFYTLAVGYQGPPGPAAVWSYSLDGGPWNPWQTFSASDAVMGPMDVSAVGVLPSVAGRWRCTIGIDACYGRVLGNAELAQWHALAASSYP